MSLNSSPYVSPGPNRRDRWKVSVQPFYHGLDDISGAELTERRCFADALSTALASNDAEFRIVRCAITS
jgi:hypothetical protein